MEKEILRILDDNGYDTDYSEAIDAAEDIAANMREFIKWLHDNTDDTREFDDALWWCIPLEAYCTIDDIYQHWLTNK